MASEQELTPIAVTVKQAARLLGTNDKQIRRGIHARELPAESRSRKSSLRRSSFPPGSTNSTVAPVQEHFVDAGVAAEYLQIPQVATALVGPALLPDFTTTRTGLTHGLERDTLLSSNATTKRKGKV